jgi:hydrogenase maturation protease
MDTLLIIGYGNPLRGDDGIGWHAARLLESHFPMAQVLLCHQLTPELAVQISNAERVIFIDASAVGDVGTYALQPVFPMAEGGTLTHIVSPSTLLSLTQGLYGAFPETLLVSVPGASFDYSETLSPLVHHLLPLVVDEVCEWVAKPLNEEMRVREWEHTH